MNYTVFEVDVFATNKRYESRPKKDRIFICENNFIPSWDEVCLTPFTSSQTCRIYPSQQRWLSNTFRHFFKFKRKLTNRLYPSPSINPKCVCSDLAKCGCLATTIWQSTYTWPTPWLHLLTKTRKKKKGKILFKFIFCNLKLSKMAQNISKCTEDEMCQSSILCNELLMINNFPFSYSASNVNQQSQ